MQTEPEAKVGGATSVILIHLYILPQPAQIYLLSRQAKNITVSKYVPARKKYSRRIQSQGKGAGKECGLGKSPKELIGLNLRFPNPAIPNAPIHTSVFKYTVHILSFESTD